MIDFEFEKHNPTAARIKVLGVGGGGSNMVNSMINAGFEHVDFIVTNTDAQALKASNAPNKIQLGVKSTKGLGAGANPEMGRKAAEEDLDKIIECLDGADIVFLTGGLGGGTGSGALPVIARALKTRDILTVAVVTKPFTFEGKRRMKVAQEALELIKNDVDTLVVIPNQNLIDVADRNVSLMNAFAMINSILNQFIRSIADIIARPGHINVDFADVKAIMKHKGSAIIGTGRATGDDRACVAAQNAISSPLLDTVQIAGSRGVLINITGGSDLSLHEVSAAAAKVYELAHEEATIIVGTVIDESCKGEVIVTIIATGFEQGVEKTVAAQPAKTVEMAVEMKEQAAAPVVEETEKVVLDLNDLDIPSVMRRMAQEKQL